MALHSHLAPFRNADRRQLGPGPGFSVVAGSRLSHCGRLFSFRPIARRSVVQNLFYAVGRQSLRRVVGSAFAHTMELQYNDRQLLARAGSNFPGAHWIHDCDLAIRPKSDAAMVFVARALRCYRVRTNLHDVESSVLRAGQSILWLGCARALLRVRGAGLANSERALARITRRNQRVSDFLQHQQLRFCLD